MKYTHSCGYDIILNTKCPSCKADVDGNTFEDFIAELSIMSDKHESLIADLQNETISHNVAANIIGQIKVLQAEVGQIKERLNAIKS